MQTQTLYVIYDPSDLDRAKVVVENLKNNVHYDRPVVLVPSVNGLNNKNILFAGTVVLHSDRIYDSLCNVTEIISLTFDETTHTPIYPSHSIIVVEHNPITRASGRAIWIGGVTPEGLSDLQTFVPTHVRNKSFAKLLAQEATLPEIPFNG